MDKKSNKQKFNEFLEEGHQYDLKKEYKTAVFWFIAFAITLVLFLVAFVCVLSSDLEKRLAFFVCYLMFGCAVSVATQAGFGLATYTEIQSLFEDYLKLERNGICHSPHKFFQDKYENDQRKRAEKIKAESDEIKKRHGISG